MTKIIQYTHRPNNTELGKGNTHETYLLIGKEHDLADLFPEGVDVNLKAVDRDSVYTVKSAIGREFRINQFGPLFRDYNVCEGDEIILTIVEINGLRNYYVRVNTYNRILLSQTSKGCMIGNIERIASYGDKENGYELNAVKNDVEGTLEIVFDAAKAKRSDSPDLTDFYTVTFNGITIENGTYYFDINDTSFFPLDKSQFDEIILNGENISLATVNNACEHKASNNQDNLPYQKIFYGAPGTGKSHEVKIKIGELDANDNEYEKNNVFRTTFHPDTDYATFVGCYKPTMQPTSKEEKTLTGKDEEITYEFVPQAFTDAYIYAYNHPEEPTYLVIEEINRGNCAQIFGDLFQLLDRKADGTSEYTIKADKDLAKYLTKELGADSEGIKDGKLCLPKNLNILATMNTSDQSLFPMDSAFKRRWDWEYIPISYTEPKSSAFMINVSDGYSWVEFIKQVNKRIFTLTQSEDKELGNFFIKNSIDAEQFKSKVMFYLWYEVLRDEVENSKYFFKYIQQDENDKEVGHKFTFTDLYGDNAETILEGFIKYILKGAE